MTTASAPNQSQRPSRLARLKAGDYTPTTQTGFQELGLDELIENPDNERKVFREMEGIASTVKKFGVIEPLIVEPVEGGKYIIVAGHRRYRAAKKAGLEAVPCIIGEPGEAHTRRRKSLITNLQREDIGAVELAEALQGTIDDDPEIKNAQQLAVAYGKDKAWVSNLLRVLTLPPELQTKLRESQRSIPRDAVSDIARLSDRAHQDQLVNSLTKGATRQQIRDQIQELKGTKPKIQKEKAHIGDYTATVTGPAGRSAKKQMIASVEALLARLKS